MRRNPSSRHERSRQGDVCPNQPRVTKTARRLSILQSLNQRLVVTKESKLPLLRCRSQCQNAHRSALRACRRVLHTRHHARKSGATIETNGPSAQLPRLSVGKNQATAVCGHQKLVLVEVVARKVSGNRLNRSVEVATRLVKGPVHERRQQATLQSRLLLARQRSQTSCERCLT